MAELARPYPRWWVAGDLDGFLGLGLDNLIQILLIVALCRGVLGYPDGLIFGTILPATGISLVLGNVAYAVQAHRLGRREGRDDRTALPYGINTVSLFAYVFLVMLPACANSMTDWGHAPSTSSDRRLRPGFQQTAGRW